jgi:hypothetical protein
LLFMLRYFVCSDIGVLKDGVTAVFRVRMVSPEKRPGYRLSRIHFSVLEDGGVVFLKNIFIHIPDNKLSQIQRNKF